LTLIDISVDRPITARAKLACSLQEYRELLPFLTRSEEKLVVPFPLEGER
jgi:hypothetical protein